MTHDGKRPHFNSALSDLEFTLGAYEGLDYLMAPDVELCAKGRDKVALLMGALNRLAQQQIEAVYAAAAEIKEQTVHKQQGAPETITDESGEFLYDSRNVARAMGRTHANLLSSIRKWMTCSDAFKKRNFKESFYTHNSLKAPHYLMTKNAIWMLLLVAPTNAGKAERDLRERIASGNIDFDAAFQRGKK